MRRRAGESTSGHPPTAGRTTPSGARPTIAARDHRRGPPTGSDRTAHSPMKPRSCEVTDGIARRPARGMLRAVGMGDDDWRKPQIGVAVVLERDHPVQPVAGPAGQGGQAGRARGRRLPAGVRHDLGLRRHLDGPRRHALLAGQPRGHRRLGGDGVPRRAARRRVLLAGCDKSLPGMLMAAARLDVAACSSTPGSTLPGQARTARPSRSSTPSRASAPAWPGKITRDELTEIEKAICPGEGACGGMYTANTMASAAEALGMSLPGSAAPPAPDAPPRRLRGRARGEAVVDLVDAGHHRAGDPDQGGVRERDHRGHGAGRLDQRRAAPAGHRARGRGRARRSTTSTGSATAPRTWPTSSRSAGT